MIDVRVSVHKQSIALGHMMICKSASSTEVRNNFSKALDSVVENHQPLRIHRQGSEDVVMIAESDYTSLVECAHLLQSPANAVRLMEAIGRSKADQIQPQTIDDLKQELNIG